ncbi:MAG TPA: YIP1 family protein [Candidatus Acidoferrum sp.]|nr:YIP1 family protein [Candidatus Acidoferrum sp.]
MSPITIETAPPAPSHPPPPTSLFAKLTNVLAYPGDVFAEVASAPPRLRNILIPTLLVGVAGVMAAGATGGDDPAAAAVAATGTAAANVVIAARLRLLSALVTLLAVFIGTGWSALVLWGIGRVFLKVRFSYWKAMEVVALTGGIVILGTVFAALLGILTDDADARPALSLLVGRLPADHAVRLAFGVFNLFHVWATAVLAIGLSKLSGGSFKESAFWVFGYWLLVKLALVMLA